MKRLSFLSLLMLMFITTWAEKVQVQITMNARSTTMTLTPKAGGEPIEVGEPDSKYVYTFEAEPGQYILEGLGTNGESNGTLEVELNEGTELTLFTIAIKASNNDWIYGKDYTLDVKVSGRDGTERVITLGTDGTRSAFLAHNGDTYHAWYVPSEARKAEGYITGYRTGTITFNAIANNAIPMGYPCTVTAPKEATVFLGSKTAHFVPFTAETPASVTEDGDNNVYSYILGEKLQYNYRVSAEGKLTTAAVFTMPSAAHSIEIAAADMAGDPKQIDRDPQANNKYNVADLFTNANEQGCIAMKTGETHQLVTLRTWEIVNSVSANYFFEPDFHFTVVDENGKASSEVVEVSADGIVTAKKAGTAFVLVTYDALNAPGQIGGPLFGAIWPENTGVVVVNVDAADAGIVPNMTLNAELNSTNDHKQAGASIDAEMDVLYFLGDAAEYTFTPEGATSVAVASPVIGENAASYNGFKVVAANADGSYTLQLTEGRNIVRLTSAAGSAYQVVRAKKCAVSIANATNPDEDLKPGDQATVTLSGLYHPAHKLAGVYNMAASIQYNDEAGNELSSKTNQYQFTATDAARTVNVTIPENCDGAYTLTGGVIKSSGYGDPYGGHRSINYTIGKNPNFTAVQHTSYFGALPDITVYEPKDYDLAVLTFEDADYKGSGNIVSDDLTHGWSTLIDNPQYGGKLLYGESGMGYDDDEIPYFWYDENNTGISGGINLGGDYGDAFWSGGTAVSNYVMNDYNGAGYTTQLAAYNPNEGGKGGHNNSDNFLVCYGYDDGSPFGRDNRPILTLDGVAVIDHAYVNLNAYGLNSAFNGDGFNVGGAGENDWVDIIAEALDAEGNPTGKTATFRAIDGKSNILQTWKKWSLAELGECNAVRFNVTSSMSGDYGMNFPAYFLLDDIAVRVAKQAEPTSGVATFEDFALEPESYWAGDEDGDDWYYGLGYTQRFKSGQYSFVNYCIPDYQTWIGYAVSNQTSTEFSTTADQFKSCVGSGNNGSANYCVAYPDGTMWGETLSIEVEGGAKVVPGFYITNSAYVVNSITKGDSFAGDPFTVGDYFKVTIHALDADGNETAKRDFCLADYRFENETDRYYVNDWQYVDLSQLGEAAAFTFTFDGSRSNAYGLTTPTYFCIDDFGAEGKENVREEGDITTGIKGLSIDRLTIDNCIYTIDGRRVQNANRPGVYIVNGRKMVVK